MDRPHGSGSGGADLARWDTIAPEYVARVGGPGDSFYRRFSPFLWSRLGDVTNKCVLDLGCGHGWLAAILATAGATVVGVDGSAELISIARAAHPSLTWQLRDLTTGLPSPARSYDHVVSHMVLMDIPTIDPLVADVASALSDGGVFVFSILHPAFFDQAPAFDPATGRWERRVRGYLDHEVRRIDTFGGHNHYHRPLSWYVDCLGRHGLAVTGVHEPPTLPAHDRPRPDWTAYERWFATIPTMIAIACRRVP